LGSENCGDGSDNGKIWFRVVNRAQAAAVRCAIFAREEKAMMEKNFLTQQQVSGDGHCHRRALLTNIFGKGSDTPTRLRQIQELLATCLENCADELDAMVFKYAHQAGFGDYCRSRANLLRQIDSNVSCSSNEWGGGDYGCDNFVMAKVLGNRVAIITENISEVSIYNGNFVLTSEALSAFQRRPGDCLLKWVSNGTHFTPYVVQGDIGPRTLVTQ
jgi:hypothetical protein